MKEKILLSWSGGKDSALALYQLVMQKKYDITLLTTITDPYERISMHGVREDLLEKQAKALGLPLEKVYIDSNGSNEKYNKNMEEVMNKYKKLGVTKVAFGDIFLEDIRKYREDNLKKVGVEAIFPLWARDTEEIANTFINLNFQSILTCVDTEVLGGEFVGRLYDKNLLKDLPESIDLGGENGEFHSFVFNGPIFKEKIPFALGEKVLRDEHFLFCDLI